MNGVSDVERHQIGHLLGSRGDHFREEDWSDPSQPASCKAMIIDWAYTVCESLEPDERRQIVNFAYYLDTRRFTDVLTRVQTGVNGSFEYGLAALILLLWHKKTAEAGD